MLQNVFSDVLELTITISFIILILISATKLIDKKYSTKWRYFVWFFISIRLCIPINISLPKTPIQVEIPAQNTLSSDRIQALSATTTSNIVIEKDASQVINATSLNPFATSSFIDIVTLIWIAGIFIFICYHLICYFMFIKEINRWSSKPQDIAISNYNIPENISVKICNKISSPQLYGFITPTILLPHENYSDSELNIILKHEMIHYKRLDLWYKLLLLFANAIHWFNPIVYVMVKRANRDIELSCDYEVIKNTDIEFRKAYSNTILQTLYNNQKHKMGLSTHFNGGKRELKERLSNIFDVDIKKRGIITFCTIILLTILSSVFVACSAPILPESNSAINKNQILLVEIPEASIYLYANAQSIENDLYKELILYSGKVSKQFMWENSTSESWKPTLLLEDLNSDSKKELIVKLISATGTGTHIEDVHILDKDTLKEFKVQSIEDIIKANVHIKTNEGSYEIKINDKTFVIDKSTLDSPMQHLFSEPVFKNYFSFEIKDNKLFATVLPQVSPTEFWGELVIEYMYRDHEFIMKSIILNKNK